MSELTAFICLWESSIKSNFNCWRFTLLKLQILPKLKTFFGIMILSKRFSTMFSDNNKPCKHNQSNHLDIDWKFTEFTAVESWGLFEDVYRPQYQNSDNSLMGIIFARYSLYVSGKGIFRKLHRLEEINDNGFSCRHCTFPDADKTRSQQQPFHFQLDKILRINTCKQHHNIYNKLSFEYGNTLGWLGFHPSSSRST